MFLGHSNQEQVSNCSGGHMGRPRHLGLPPLRVRPCAASGDPALAGVLVGIRVNKKPQSMALASSLVQKWLRLLWAPCKESFLDGPCGRASCKEPQEARAGAILKGPYKGILFYQFLL